MNMDERGWKFGWIWMKVDVADIWVIWLMYDWYMTDADADADASERTIVPRTVIFKPWLLDYFFIKSLWHFLINWYVDSVFFSNCKLYLVTLHFLDRFLFTRWLPRIQCDTQKLFHLVPWYKFSTFAKNKVKWNFNLDLSSICLKPEQLKDTHLWAWGTDEFCQVMGLKLYQPFLGEVMETGKSLGLIQYQSRFQILNKVFASKHLFKIGINSL